jgi:cyclase
MALDLFLLLSLAASEPITAVAPGVWMREGDLSAYGHCNNAVIEMKDYLIVVDANFPSGAKALMREIGGLSRKPVKYVVLTHHHGDHAYGSAVWRAGGATTIAHEDMAAEIGRYEPRRWREELPKRADLRELGAATLERPQQVFSRSPHVFDDGERRVELWHFGWGHTKGDVYVWLPRERILIAGDAVVNGPYNYTGDSHLGNWRRILEKLGREWKPLHVVPGHGKAGGAEVLAGQAGYFAAIEAAVREQVQGRVGLGELTAPRLEGAISRWLGSPVKEQLADFHSEITTGQPAGAKPR